MRHNLKIRVSKKPENGGIVSCRSISVREKILRFLLGCPTKLTILVPGDSVESLSINEIVGGEANEAV